MSERHTNIGCVFRDLGGRCFRWHTVTQVGDTPAFLPLTLWSWSDDGSPRLFRIALGEMARYGERVEVVYREVQLGRVRRWVLRMARLVRVAFRRRPPSTRLPK